MTDLVQGPIGEEPLAGYRPGGYYAASLGETLAERYTIVRKIGWGVYSTVWLAKVINEERHVALKILTSDYTQDNKLHELEFLERARNSDPTNPGYTCVSHLLDCFLHRGPDGLHRCLVMEPLGEHVQSFSHRYLHNKLPLPLVKKIAKDVLLALDYLNRSCNILHTDLKPDNLLTVLDGPELLIKNASPPYTYAPVVREDGTPVVYVATAPLQVEDPDILTSVKLSDFGLSCWADRVEEHFTDLIQPVALRAPEVAIGAGWDEKADIWSLGCIINDLATGLPLFDHDIDPGSQVALTIINIGEFPWAMLERGRYNGLFFNDDGSFKVDLSNDTRFYPYSNLFKQRKIRLDASPAEEAAFISFVTDMLTIEPRDRPAALELLSHEFLRGI